jgi:voltage-gated potassium channel
MPVYSRRPVLIISMAFTLLIVGTAGYRLIEGWSWLDAFYMTVIGLSTVGFGEVRPLTQAGRLFTSALLIANIFVIAYGVEAIISARVGGQIFRRRQMMRQVKRMENHVIVCGYGRVGESSVSSLVGSKRDIVVIEKEPEIVAVLESDGCLVVQGDATQDEVLQRAGVERAWGLIVCTGEDSVNLFIVLSARALNKSLFIVARSINEENERKMRLAGADRVVSPYQIGGRHMANIAIRPHVTDFFDVVTLDDGVELWVEELAIHENSSLIGKTVGEVDIRRQTGVTIIAIYDHMDGRATLPRARTILNAGNQMVVLGTRQQLAQLQALAEGSEIGNR